MKSIPLLRQVTIVPAISYLGAEGVPVHKYLRGAGLSVPSPEDLETLVPLHQVSGFLSSVASGEGINDLGFRVGGQQGTECLGLFGSLLAQALTIHETIEISTAMVSSYNSGVHVWTERHGDQVRYCHKYAECLSRDRTTEIEHLAFAIALANCGYGRWARWQLTRIDLATDPIELSAFYPALAEVPVYFNQPHTALWCHQSVLSAPLRPIGLADHEGVDEDQRHCYARSGPAADPIGQLQQAIESILGHPDMSLQLAATITGTSPRTLQRRLAEDGTSFSRTLQAVRFRNARRLLQDPEMPSKEISKRLGYTDPANFMRAFKRWTGVSPNEFRRLHYGDV